jgi:PLP dependent protein
MDGTIRDNVRRVMDGIADSAASSGRNPSDVVLVAVTKTRTAGEIDEAIRAGITHIGENRVQEAECKMPLVGSEGVWHLVGPLQSNKGRRAAELFSWIDTVHSEKIALVLSERASALGRALDVLVQINISGEETKSGVAPAAARELLVRAGSLPGLTVRGLMTIGSLEASPAEAREEFRAMRGLFDRLREDPEVRPQLDVLSMGMSGDYRIAVAEGATMVRVGTAIFGGRT